MRLSKMTALLAVPLAALALGACGGEDPPSKADFVAEADGHCRATNRENPPKQPPANAKEAAVQAGQEVQIREELDRKLRELEAPDEVKGDFDAYNSKTTELIGILKAQKTAAEKDDEKRFTAETERFNKAATQRESIARRIGFKVCGLAQPAEGG